MEYDIDIVVKKRDLIKLELDEKTFSGNEGFLSDFPKRYRISENIELVESSYYTESDQDIDLLVKGGIEELCYDANNNKDRLINNLLIQVFEKVCELDYFQIIICDVDENIDENIELDKNADLNICDLVVYTLDWDSPKNVKIYRKP